MINSTRSPPPGFRGSGNVGITQIKRGFRKRKDCSSNNKGKIKDYSSSSNRISKDCSGFTGYSGSAKNKTISVITGLGS
jgi:hypothetical protein